MSRKYPLSEFIENADEIVRCLADDEDSHILTQDGEPVAVMMNYEQFQITEKAALLAMLALSQEQVRQGKTKPADEVFDRLESELRARQ